MEGLPQSKTNCVGDIIGREEWELNREQLEMLSNEELQQILNNAAEYHTDEVLMTKSILQGRSDGKKSDVQKVDRVVSSIVENNADGHILELERIMTEQTREIRTIKKCCIFFAVLAIISIVGALIFGVSVGGMIGNMVA